MVRGAMSERTGDPPLAPRKIAEVVFHYKRAKLVCEAVPTRLSRCSGSPRAARPARSLSMEVKR